jgi:hypothetical protein
VFAHDIVSSPADTNIARIGDPIDQPGVVDVTCQNVPNDYVAHLSTLSTLNTPANVDCAIAEVIAGAVRADGAILGIGAVSSSTLAPSVFFTPAAARSPWRIPSTMY